MQRAKAILIDPLAEWDRIARRVRRSGRYSHELRGAARAHTGLFGFIGACLIGVIGKDGTVLRAPLVDGIFGAIFGYVVGCAIVLVLGLGIDVLAPLFGGQRGFDNAFKLAVYSFTPVWLAGFFCCCLACVSSRCSVFTAPICYGLACRG